MSSPYTHNFAPRELAVAASIKAAALVVILGIFVSLAEQVPSPPIAQEDSVGRIVVYVVGHRDDPPPPVPLPPMATRPHAGDVTPHVEAF